MPAVRWCRLVLSTASLEAPLPDLQPGALSQLRSLALNVVNACAGKEQAGCTPRVEPRPLQLPASWGSSGVLPALAELTLNLQGFVGPLPAEWARGFPSLSRLAIGGNSWMNCARSGNDSAGSPAGGSLPPEWGGGLPRVTQLALAGLGLSGSFPEAWLSGLPALMELSLSGNALTSTLPAQLLRHHPNLTRIQVGAGIAGHEGGCTCTAAPTVAMRRPHCPLLAPSTSSPLLQLDLNRFEGRLPDEWGKSALEFLGLGGNPLLEGPAFPPAWLQPGRMSSLRTLRLSDSTRLGGALPANLSWPLLKEL